MSPMVWTLSYMAVLVFVTSFGLHYLAYKKGVLDGNDYDDLEDELDLDDGKSIEKELEADLHDDQSHGNPVIKKWLNFGGGYYGTIAFIHLMLIELKQLYGLITNWQGLDAYTKGTGLNAIINLAVNMFVEQFHNFAAAISWPAKYLSNYVFWYCALFIAITYGLFYVAQSMAWRYYQQRLPANKE